MRQMAKRKILLLGKLPPPYMGPAIATGIILNSDLKNRFDLLFLNTKANDSISTLGKWSLGKIFKNLSLYFEMRRLIIKDKPDLVLVPISQTTSGFVKDSFYILLARWYGIKIVIQLRGSNFKAWLAGSSTLTGKYVKFILKRASGVIVLGDKLKYLFADYFPDERIFVVPNGGDYVIPERRRNSDEIRIIYLSNLLSSKGIEDVFRAIEILWRTNKNFSVDLIGEWLHAETRSFCTTLMIQHGLPIRIHSSSASHQKLGFLADADIFIFPPRDPEGHPWSVIEAMAAGLPIISTDKGAITESVIDGKNGYIVEPGNPEAIAQKVLLLMNNNELRKKMGNDSRNLYLQNFTETRMVENFTNVFNRIIQEG